MISRFSFPKRKAAEKKKAAQLPRRQILRSLAKIYVPLRSIINF